MEVNFHQWLSTLDQFSAAQLLLSSACQQQDPSHLCVALREASSLLYDCAMLVKVPPQSILSLSPSRSLHFFLLPPSLPPPLPLLPFSSSPPLLTLLSQGSDHSTSLHMNLLANMADLLNMYSQLLSLCVTHQYLLPPSSLTSISLLQAKVTWCPPCLLLF